MRRALEIEGVRVTGDPARIVTEVGTCWGGGGLDRNMRLWQQHLLPRGIEALIVGETCDFAQRFAAENGIALLEGGHSATEDPGLARLALDLQQQFPEIPVLFRPQEVPWITL
jgi:putative NIF3 family GTP cyclohydrolase 1 type 2